MSGRIPLHIWDRVRQLFLTLEPDGKPRFGGPSNIAAIINEEFGLNVGRVTISRKITEKGWRGERDAFITAAMRRVSGGKTTSQDEGMAPQGDMMNVEGTSEDALLNRTKLAIIGHMESYLSGTKKVTEAALKAIEFELYIHTKAMTKVNSLLQAGADVLSGEVLMYRKVMLSPIVLSQIARLGQIMTTGQVSIALNHVQRVVNKTLIMQWGNDPYPDPPEPDAMRLGTGQAIDAPADEEEGDDDEFTAEEPDSRHRSVAYSVKKGDGKYEE